MRRKTRGIPLPPSPTTKQLIELKRLGVTKPIYSKKHAQELIDRLRKEEIIT